MNILKALQKAVNFHKNNNLQKTEQQYRAILAKAPDDPDANYNLGVLAMQSNKPEIALPLFEKALKANPTHSQYQQSLAMAKDQLKVLPADNQNTNQQLTALFNQQRSMGIVASQMKDYDKALLHLQKALALNPKDAISHNSLAVVLKNLGRPEEAEASYREALRLKPDYAIAHNSLGNILIDLGRLEEAEASYREALRLKPDYAMAHNNLGCTLKNLGRLEEAEASYREALRLKPDFVEVYQCLFDLYEKSNQLDKLAAAMQNADQNIPNHPVVAVWKADLLSKDKGYAEAYELLKNIQIDLLQEDVRRKYYNSIASLAHRLKHYDEAFASYQACNQMIMQSNEYAHYDKTRYTKRIDTLFECFTKQTIASWNECFEPGGITPVFIIGFPRSGTTLLDTILRSHSQVSVVEEQPMMSKVIAALPKTPEMFAVLSHMDDQQCEKLQNIYYEELNKHIDHLDAQRIIIDKFPLNIVEVGIIKMIFPSAKFILALRHPYDSVLSCFMQNFKLNDAMANFLTLEDSANLYHKVMRLFDLYQNIFNLNVHVIKYEELVNDFEQTLKSLLTFLDLPWDDAMKNYQETAIKRGFVNTPSYNQVTKPIYKTAQGRWRHYREQMTDILPVLSPWCDYFEYEKE